MWDTGKMESEHSIHVELNGLTSVSCQRYFYRVRAWSHLDKVSSWSEVAYFETGFLDPEEWKAQWISAPVNLLAGLDMCPLFRKTFQVRKELKYAAIYATSLGLYELELNGHRVGDYYFTPGWTSYHHRLQYQTYDVTDSLKPGLNAIGALMGNGWYKGHIAWGEKRDIAKRNNYGDRTALLLQLHITYQDGERDVLVTDSSWKSAPSPVLMSEIYHGETYDARLELPGWSTAGFIECSYSSAEVLYEPKQRIVAQETEPVRKISESNPINLIRTPKGELLLDMGQNMVGWVRFSLNGNAGQELQLLHGEVLDPEGNFYSDNLLSAKQTVTYICKGEGKETFEPHFTYMGFRYVLLVGFAEPISLCDFTGVVLHTDMERTGYFVCSDPLVNQLQHNILWGQKGNFLEVPTDCPQRDERLGWTGDAQMFIRTASFLMNVAPFFTKWMRDLKVDQHADGGVPFVIPQVLDEKAHSSSAWGDAAVICPWTIYQSYGDTRVLEQQYESMKAWVSHIRNQGDNPYLWNTGFHFGDWLGLDSKQGSYVGATDRDYIATAFYAYSTSLLAKTAKILDKQNDHEAYMSLYTNIVDAFHNEFVTPSGRLSVSTQTAYVLALKFGLLAGPAKERAVHKLANLLEENNNHLTTGFVGTPYLNLVLSEEGLNDIAYQLLLQTDYPSWLYQVTKGATTIWEHWDGIKEDGSFWSSEMNSFNHYAYGSIGDWLYSVVAGIRTDEDAPGYKHIHIKPKPGKGLTSAEATLDSMYGTIHSSWRLLENDQLEMKVKIPCNTTATVLVPGAQHCTENGNTIDEVSGIHSTHWTKDGLLLTVGSGDYHFRAQSS